MEKIFDICVQLMIIGAHQLGITYKELNVWLFVIIHPLITIGFIGLTLYYRRKSKKILSSIEKKCLKEKF